MLSSTCFREDLQPVIEELHGLVFPGGTAGVEVMADMFGEVMLRRLAVHGPET